MSNAKVNIMVDNGIYDEKDHDFIPHTFLKITHPDGSITYSGFAPITTGLTGPGAIHDDSKHPFDISSPDIPLTNNQYNNLVDYIDNSTTNPPYYDLPYGVQCTAWALNALSSSDIIPDVLAPDLDASNPVFGVINTIMFNPYTQYLGFKLNDYLDGINDYMDSFANLFGIPPNDPTPPVPRHDPLVLDTNKDGFISTIALADSNTYFDITGDGIKEKVSWIGANDGLLTYDKNENGKIDGIDEVFGNLTTSGFDELKQLIDSNHDGKIDRKDELYSRLKVWNDNNSDGISQNEELTSLKEAGITSIDLNVVLTNIELGGATLSEASKYTDTEGNKELAADVKLDVNPTLTRIDTSTIPDYSVDLDTLTLPNLREAA